MGIFGTMILLTIIAFLMYIFTFKVIGSCHKETNSTDEAIKRDTDEFNGY